jgi:hypothetical protein
MRASNAGVKRIWKTTAAVTTTITVCKQIDHDKRETKESDKVKDEAVTRTQSRLVQTFKTGQVFCLLHLHLGR